MNKDMYLDFFYKLVKNNQIFEKTTLNKFLKDKRIEDRDTYKKEINRDIFICKIELENEKILLLEDFPINFLISQTIIVGDKSKIVEFSVIGEDKIYLCNRELLTKLKDKFEIGNLKEINPRDVANKNFKFNFERPKIVGHLVEYISSVKNLDFNKIHLVQSEKVELFVPSAKHTHFKLAANMSIPLISLIDNNYIKESIINIYDTNKIQEITKPIISYKQKIFCDVLKKNDLRLYNDVDNELYIKFDSQEIIRLLYDCKKTNFDIDKISKEIKKFDSKFQISSNHGKTPIPLWKSTKNQKYIEIIDSEDFNEISGVKFRIKSDLFEDLYLQTLSGEEAKYKRKFLKKKFEPILENLKDTQSIIFKNEYDLIIQLMYNKDNNIKNILIDENINEFEILEIKNNIKHILKELILASVESSKIPRFEKPQFLLEKYYLSVSISIRKLYEKYLEDLSKKDLIRGIKKYLIHIIESMNNTKIKYEQLYFLSIIVLNSLKILEEFDKDTSKKIKEIFNAYFKEFNICENNSKVDLRLEKFVYDIVFTRKISKDNEIKIIEKIGFDKSLIKDLDLTIHEPSYQRYVKPNNYRLKELFKYNFEDVAKQIIKLKPNEINDFSVIRVKDKFLEFKPDFYIIFKKYEDYNEVLENEWFRVLVKKCKEIPK